MKKTLIAAGLSTLGLLSAVGYAQTATPTQHQPRPDMTRAQFIQKLDARFDKIDINHDGKITPEERQAARQARRDERFAKLDTNGDGQLSRAEFDAGHGGHGGHHGHHGGGMFGRGMMGGDRNATITKAEFERRALARFDRLDANHDGTVTAAERKAAWDAMKARRTAPQG